jgi:hypothetical protein
VTPAWQRVARAFAATVESGRLDLPLPGGGRTRQRWAAFADLAGEDLSLVRLAEGHADAVDAEQGYDAEETNDQPGRTPPLTAPGARRSPG